ncbi:transglutaminase TgpA family protein [Tundrisphaera lichenicola]|uniref:transglutaminase TgpA family protein n=1 Tax=Tundrisphaera lichenicola TaxID=2029860 RepID=UPI003EB95F45
MKFVAIYRASFYLMLTFATLVLSIDAAADSPLSILFPPAVICASVIAFLTVDRNPRLAPSRNVASLLAMASAGLSYAEYKHDNNLLLLAAAHWLVYLQIIKIFLPKTVEDDWFLFLLGLVQVLVGGVMSQSDKVGMALFGWSLLSLWVLTLFALHRDALRMNAASVASSAELIDRTEPYRGLIDPPFLFATARVAATTLALGGLIFLAMPRRSSMGSSQSGGAVGKHLSGFDDEVQLGQLGEILENDSVVMSVELFDRSWARLPAPEAEMRWRGVSMEVYEKRGWRRVREPVKTYPLSMGDRWSESPVIRQVIKLEPTDSRILFAFHPILEAETSDLRYTPELSAADGSLIRTDTKTSGFDYQVTSASDSQIAQPGEKYPSTSYLGRLLELPTDLKPRLRSIAQNVVKNIPADDAKRRAEAVEGWLRDSGEFQYTLQMSVSDPKLDPVEDFLVNRKAGHCEYFASSLTLLLRSIDIPARVVNGFQGGDYNSMAGVITVRQKHAHSWVEALVGRTRNKSSYEIQPTWLTLDPTPADQRSQSVARVGGLAGNFRQITDFIRYVWVFYIVGFNSERQSRFLYGPIRSLIVEARNGFSIMGEAIRGWLHFPSVESFFSLRGFVVSFLALLLLVAIARLANWSIRWLIRRISGSKSSESSDSAGIVFYRRLLHLLAGYGLERPPAETPREFARRAAIYLSGHGSGAEAVSDVPPLVVDAFYRIRFGEHTISDEESHHVTARLDALESRLRPQKS